RAWPNNLNPRRRKQMAKNSLPRDTQDWPPEELPPRCDLESARAAVRDLEAVALDLERFAASGGLERLQQLERLSQELIPEPAPVRTLHLDVRLYLHSLETFRAAVARASERLAGELWLRGQQ